MNADARGHRAHTCGHRLGLASYDEPTAIASVCHSEGACEAAHKMEEQATVSAFTGHLHGSERVATNLAANATRGPGSRSGAWWRSGGLACWPNSTCPASAGYVAVLHRRVGITAPRCTRRGLFRHHSTDTCFGPRIQQPRSRAPVVHPGQDRRHRRFDTKHAGQATIFGSDDLDELTAAPHRFGSGKIARSPGPPHCTVSRPPRLPWACSSTPRRHACHRQSRGATHWAALGCQGPAPGRHLGSLPDPDRREHAPGQCGVDRHHPAPSRRLPHRSPPRRRQRHTDPPYPRGGSKTFLTSKSGYRGKHWPAKRRHGMRLGHLRGFFDRIIEWDYPDAPPRNPVFAGDMPIRDRPLPRFLSDTDAAALLTQRPQPAQPVRPGHRRGLGPHGRAQRRIPWTDPRRDHRDRRQQVAAHPGRQAAHRPLHPAASQGR